MRASSDSLFRRGYAAQQQDNELFLIKGVCVRACESVCQRDEYSKKIVCGNIPEEQLACCYTHTREARLAHCHHPVIV